jgi:hypothetical protein
MTPDNPRSDPTTWDDDYVCPACIDDDGLGSFIREQAQSTVCTFCGQTGSAPMAARLADVTGYIEICLYREFEDAAGFPPWGGWEPDLLDGYEVLEEAGLEFSDDLLMDKIGQALSKITWCVPPDWDVPEHQRLQYDWEYFCRLIKYEQRFFFSSTARDAELEPDLEPVSPVAILHDIAEACSTLGLFRHLQRGQLAYRVRFNSRPHFETSTDFGPPPRDIAVQSNRMNPPGIPMLYVSFDQGTALAETIDVVGKYTVATLELLRQTRVLDLTELPRLPSLFCEEVDPNRSRIRFLHRFVREITRPIPRDNRVHIDYIPTQVVTEYFRTVYDGSRNLDGIVFPSARNPSGKNLVLFSKSSDIIQENVGWSARVDPTWDVPPSGSWIKVVKVREIHEAEIWQHIAKIIPHP